MRVGNFCRAVPVLRHLTYVSPNAAECVAMAAAVRRKRGGSVDAAREAVSGGDAVVELTQGASAGPRSARQVVDHLLPSVQTLLEVSQLSRYRAAEGFVFAAYGPCMRTPSHIDAC